MLLLLLLLPSSWTIMHCTLNWPRKEKIKKRKLQLSKRKLQLSKKYFQSRMQSFQNWLQKSTRSRNSLRPPRGESDSTREATAAPTCAASDGNSLKRPRSMAWTLDMASPSTSEDAGMSPLAANRIMDECNVSLRTMRKVCQASPNGPSGYAISKLRKE